MSELHEWHDLADITARMVAAYFQNPSHKVEIKDIPLVIDAVRESIGRITYGVTVRAFPRSQTLNMRKVDANEANAGDRKPAVDIADSVKEDRIFCLECGWPMRTLKRHIITMHGLSPEAYRERWNLPRDYPMVTNQSAKQRSKIARNAGLGTSIKPEYRYARPSSRRASGVEKGTEEAARELRASFERMAQKIDDAEARSLNEQVSARVEPPNQGDPSAR